MARKVNPLKRATKNRSSTKSLIDNGAQNLAQDRGEKRIKTNNLFNFRVLRPLTRKSEKEEKGKGKSGALGGENRGDVWNKEGILRKRQKVAEKRGKGATRREGESGFKQKTGRYSLLQRY